MEKIYFEKIYFKESDYKDGLCLVKNPKGKYGYIGLDGKEVIKCRYSLAHGFKDGIAEVKKSGKWGIINKEGLELTQFIYDSISKIEKGLYWVEIHSKKRKAWDWNIGKGGIINQYGEIILPIEYDAFTYIDHSDNYGDYEDFIPKFINGKSLIWKDGKEGYINKNGIEIIPCIYDSIVELELINSDYFAKVKKEGKWGLINKDGEEVVPCIYFSININKNKNGIELNDGIELIYKSVSHDDKKIII